MTQLDLPQVSLQRYVDLLRRKTWQVIPVSILGLLLGGLVALLIPRYYVAEIELSHQRLPGGPEARPLTDPMAEMVSNARSTIPNAIPETLRQLGWPDAQLDDPFEQTEYERALRGRLEIRDENAGLKDRSFAALRLVYKDRDGRRAAAFLNRLVPVWNKKVFDELRVAAQKAVTEANDQFDTANNAWLQCNHQLATILERYHIEPTSALEDRSPLLRAAEDQRARLQAELERSLGEVAGLDREVKELQGLVDTLPRTVPVNTVAADPKLREQLLRHPELLLLQKRIEELELGLQGMNPGHPQRAAAEKELAAKTQKRDELIAKVMAGTSGADNKGEVDNPKFLEARDKLQAQQALLVQAGARLAALQRQMQAYVDRQAELALGFRDYRQAQRNLDDADEARKKARARVDQARQVLADIERPDLIRVRRDAVVPPKPTDPNVFLVALIGCVAGLGAAVALILLLDLLQGTFKTLDDVERGLPVPVLGGMAHLELPENRRAVHRQRRRASVLVGAILVLVVAVVTIWKVDPTRLPAFVSDALKLLLGEG